MTDEGPTATEIETTSPAPGNPPYDFTVSLTEAETAKGRVRSLTVTGADPLSGSEKTREYQLLGNEHKSYIRFYAGLAEDFGARVPRNSRPFSKPTFRADYRTLLTENLAPGILYGYGDPAVLRVEDGPGGGWYYLVATSNDAPDSFPILRSRDLVKWEFVDFVFPRGKKPAWAADGETISDYWAPEMHKMRGEFRVYFVARHRQTRELCIGMAKSSRPEGPFEGCGEPILVGDVIDPHVFVESDDKAFLFWKEDNNGLWPSRLGELLYEHPHLIAEFFPQREDQVTASFLHAIWPWAKATEPMELFFIQQPLIEAVTDNFSDFDERLKAMRDGEGDARIRDDLQSVLGVLRTPIYAQELSPDGARLVGGRKKIIENDQPWEAHLVEGIWVTKYGRKYYLFYAGNDFSTDQYGIGVAIADDPSGPYSKVPGPFLSSTTEWAGPGHPSVVTGPDGKPELFLHAFFRGRSGYKEFRVLLAAPIEFREDRVVLRKAGPLSPPPPTPF